MKPVGASDTLRRVLSEVADFLPAELPVEEIDAYASIPRSFDRASGEILVVRLRGRLAVLTRPTKHELYRAIPCDPAQPVALLEKPSRIAVRVVDGRLLTLELADLEVSALKALVDGTARLSSVDQREKRRRSEPSMPRVRRTPMPPKGSYDSLREPESAEAEVVRIPARISVPPNGKRRSSFPPPEPREETSTALAVRSTSAVVPVTPPPSVDDEPKRDSIRPPAFSDEIELPPPESLRDIVGLRAQLKQHWERGQLDLASQVARVLSFAGVADMVEQRLATLVPEEPPTFNAPISAELQRLYVSHVDEDRDLASLFSALWPSVLMMRLRPEDDLRLRQTDEVDFARPGTVFARLFSHGVKVLALPPIRLYVRNDVSGGLAHLPISPIGSLSGRTLLQGYGRSEALHVIGGHLWFYRPESYLFALMPNTTDLLNVVCGALMLEGRMPPDPRVVPVATELERYMVREHRTALASVASRLELPGDPRTSVAASLQRYRRAAHLGAMRVGLVLSGSLEKSIRTQRIMPPVSGISVDDLVDDLLGYVVSPSFGQLRRELGIAVEPGAALREPTGG